MGIFSDQDDTPLDRIFSLESHIKYDIAAGKGFLGSRDESTPTTNSNGREWIDRSFPDDGKNTTILNLSPRGCLTLYFLPPLAFFIVVSVLRVTVTTLLEYSSYGAETTMDPRNGLDLLDLILLEIGMAMYFTLIAQVAWVFIIAAANTVSFGHKRFAYVLLTVTFIFGCLFASIVRM